jgi:lipoprotein-anchoring transpeptidase ErfK/SrfK
MRALSLAALAGLLAAPALAAPAAPVPTAPPVTAITAESIAAADLAAVPAALEAPAQATAGAPAPEPLPDPAIVKLQVLLDRAGASPGVIDGYDGENVRKALIAFEAMHGLQPDGHFGPDVADALPEATAVVGGYTVTADDLARLVPPIPADYAEQATFARLDYTSVPEELAERFHMDVDLLMALNPGATFSVGETIAVTDPGADRQGEVAAIEADKSLRQVRAYAADGTLLVAYPATIGSTDTPSPSGTYTVEAVVPDPDYTYNPKVNFQQGSNTEVLTLPPGPNNPVGSTWIDLSKPTYGIHGTPEPSLIDKTASHGCVRLTNWDAAELAGMVKKGVTVTFVGTPPEG